MARRKYEFRPDRPHRDLLSKLYLTRQQQQALLRWVLHAVVLVAASVLQDSVLCKVQLYGAAPDLVPCAIILICILRGADRSAVFALIAAMLYKFSGTAPGYYSMALIPLLGLTAAMLRQSYFRRSFSSTMLCTCTAVFLYEMCVFACGLIFGHTTTVRAMRFVITGLMSLVLCPILYPISTAIEKIGEKSWKE